MKGRDQGSRPRIWIHSAWDQQCSHGIRDQDVLDNNKNIKMHFYSDSQLEWHFEIFKAVYCTRTTQHLMMNTLASHAIVNNFPEFFVSLTLSCQIPYVELTFRISLVRTGCTRESPEPVVHLRRFSVVKKKDDRSLRR